MPTLRDYFMEESAACLDALQALAEGDADSGDVVRIARTLRGTAHMAREDRAYRAALALESAARALAAGSLGWTDDTRDRLRYTVADLRSLVDGRDGAAALDALEAAVRTRWADAAAVGPHPAAAEPDELKAADDAFHEFAAREVAAIANALAAGVDGMIANPHDREPLKSILRRQRPLLGTARLDEIAIVAESLRAVEDISRVIARLDVGIKDEWLDVFRCARDIMRAASDSLDSGEQPAHTNALSRLRTLHAELLDRFGAVEAGPASTVLPNVVAGSAPPPGSSTPPGGEAGGDAGDAPLEIAELMYDRDEALRRIAELRPRIERGVTGDPDARAAVDELFDMIRIAFG
jgi:chemotaxis protein histidine kinase CheA